MIQDNILREHSIGLVFIACTQETLYNNTPCRILVKMVQLDIVKYKQRIRALSTKCVNV